MASPNFILLYVASPATSVSFYKSLLGKPPVEESPTFAMFGLESGVMLGLWKADTVEPRATKVGGSEMAFAVGGKPAVDAILAEWKALGVEIIQQPAAMDFGYTFTAVDPDGHRLRVFAPGGEG